MDKQQPLYSKEFNLYFCYNLKLNRNYDFSLSNLTSQFEANFKFLFDFVNQVDSKNSSFIVEGGWYFNDVSKLQKAFPNHELFYFIINPSLSYLRQAYLKRHPNSRKELNNDLHWVKYDKVLISGLRQNQKLLTNNSIRHIEINDEDLNYRIKKIISVLKNRNEPTIYIITGPNASGKSTLFLELIKFVFNINDEDGLKALLKQ
jgi:pantothenate kinase